MSTNLHAVEEGETTNLTTEKMNSSSGAMSFEGSSVDNQKSSFSPLSLALKTVGGLAVATGGILLLNYLVFNPEESSSSSSLSTKGESNLVEVDYATTSSGADDLNQIIDDLKAKLAIADPSTLPPIYSNLGIEGSPFFSGLEPEEMRAARLEKFPFLEDVKFDRFLINSSDVINSRVVVDDAEKWGIIHANVRGHYDTKILVSPEYVSTLSKKKKIQTLAKPSTTSASEATDKKDLTLVGASSLKSAGTFNWDEAMTALHHSEVCYCDENTYLGRTYGGTYLSGFTATYHISNPRFDTAGYIGYDSGDQTIHVSFRGSASLNNWITTNIDVMSTSYPHCNDCRVHSGFYDAAMAVFPNILGEVTRLRSMFPSYKVIVTGHSLGGALSHLTALELEFNSIGNLELYTFGSPRVCNDEMAEYSTHRLPTASRVTHDKDLVVHTPGSIFYTHMAGEWHQPDDDVRVVECFGYEDRDCSYQYTFTSIEDHMWYLGVEMGEDGCAGVTYS